MKSKIIVLILVLFTILGLGCSTNNKDMYIECEDKVIIQEYIDLKVYQYDQEVSLDNIKWSLSDYNVANIIDGKLYGKNYGFVTIAALDSNDNIMYCSKTVEVVPPYVTDIIINGKNEMYVGKTISLTAKVLPELITSEIVWSSSNEDILVVDEGEVYGLEVGSADVIVTCDGFEKRYAINVLPTPTTIEIHCEKTISLNDIVKLSFNIEDEVQLQSSNTAIIDVVDDTVIAVSEGIAVITATKVSDSNVKGTIEIKVKKNIESNFEMTSEEKIKINEILNKMSLEQKVGQMFNIGLYVENNRWGELVEIEAATGLPYAQFGRANERDTVLNFLSEYRFGNFTVYGEVGKTRQNLQLATNTLKELGKSNTSVNPFISISSAGGFLMECLSALPTNQALANANIKTIQRVNELYASELNALGINAVINPYLNNNLTYNSTLATYGTNINKAMATSVIVSDAFKSQNVVMVPSLSIYGQYTDDRSLEELQSKDLKLLETIIQNGAQMVSLPSTVITSIKENYYSILNEDFMQKYIREQLKYNGVVYMGDGAIDILYQDENFYTYVVNAINLGVDMIGFDLMFTNSYYSRWYKDMTLYKMGLYNHIIDKVNDNTISIERINEAVTRILLTKLRNNVLEDNKNTDFNFETVNNEIVANAPKFISVIGNSFSIEKDENILIISESFEKTGTTNSLGDNFRKYFVDRGYKNITIYHADTLYADVILGNAGKYDKVIIAASDVNQNSTIGFAAGKVNFINFVDDILAKNSNVYVISTGLPYITEYLPNVKNFILLYNYYENNFESLCKLLNNEVNN